MLYRFGLIGEKLGHSFSPKLHMEIMKKNGIEGTYDLIEIPKDKFEDEFNKIKQSGYNGVNVTIPYKERVIPLLDSLSVHAEYIGAVNTVSFSHGKAIGYNTDYDGFLSMMDSNSINIMGARAVILGAGGVTKAVIKALIDRKVATITIVSTRRDPMPGFKALSYQEYIASTIRSDFIVNCTPVGMYPDIDKSPLPSSAIRTDAVIELIYNPAETRLMQDASALHIKTVNGMEMLHAQAAKAQQIWMSTL